MDVSEEHIRHILLFLFRKNQNGSEATREIQNVYGEGVLSESKCRRWFAKFRNGNFDLKDEPRSGRPEELDDELLKSTVERNPTVTVRELASELNVSHMTIHRHLTNMGKVIKLGKWVPHHLSQNNLQQRIEACTALLSRHNQEPFLNRIVTGDEKWVLYNNIKRRHQWLSPEDRPAQHPRDGLHPLKVLLCVWWDAEGIIHFELLPHNQTITAEVYCQQLCRLKSALEQKRPGLVNRRGVLFHQDNARPHTARTTCTQLQEFGWEKMVHPPYSPDLAPSDFHLFRSLQNFLDGKNFRSRDDVQEALGVFFSSKPNNFFSDGIKKLPERWAEVLSNEGNYIDD